MTTTTSCFAVSAGVADIRRYPDPAAELVTQALMNAPATAGEVAAGWTHVTLADYEGWIRTNQLQKPINKAYGKVGKSRGTSLQLTAVINKPHSVLFAQPGGLDTLGTVYLSTALPVLDATGPEHVQVIWPGEQIGWLRCSDILLHHGHDIYPRMSIDVITAHARAFLGRPYLWGGTSWEGIDCSGFVQLCYRMGGYTMPRDGDQQHDFWTRSVKREELQAGDLIFFGSKEITHVAMALNHKEYIHAEGQNYNCVVINSFDPADAHYYPRLDEIVWGIKRVAV
jgi:gamma-D-glutamyl-L-lysine dipeptidyl-peptidase